IDLIKEKLSAFLLEAQTLIVNEITVSTMEESQGLIGAGLRVLDGKKVNLEIEYGFKGCLTRRKQMSSLEIRNGSFYMGNEPVQLIVGGMHYFRIVPAYWEDRLRKLKTCGFNCVETYIPWNFHEPEEGKFTFSGMADVEAFIRVAQRVGLYVIVRPGPYICAEWE